MKKGQIICLLGGVLGAGLIMGGLQSWRQHQDFIAWASRTIGEELAASTNSAKLVQISPDLQTRLAELKQSPVHVAQVLPGDEPSSSGNGTASSRLLLTNETGQGLLLRLRQDESPDKFQVLGFRTALAGEK